MDKSMEETIEECRKELYAKRDQYRRGMGQGWPYGLGDGHNDDLAELHEIGTIQVYDCLIDVYEKHFPKPKK